MKTVLVAGATGQQGRSVIQALCQSDEYLCLALTRDVASSRARKIASLKNVQLVSGDLNNIDQLRNIFIDAANNTKGGPIWGVFVALIYSGLGASWAREEAQGKNIMAVANEFNVQALVYSSSSIIPYHPEGAQPPPGLDQNAKFVLERHTSTLSIPWTIIRPGFFMENFSPGLIGRLTNSTIRSCLPVECKLQFVAVDDVGRLTRVIFDDPLEFRHKVLDVAGDCLTPREYNQAFARATGKGIPRVPNMLAVALYWLNKDIRNLISIFIQADGLRRKDPNGYNSNLREAGTYLQLNGFEEWAKRWDLRARDEINDNGVTIWSLIAGKAK